MTDGNAHLPEPDDTAVRLQRQLDDLQVLVQAHQRLFEAMFAAGQLPPDVNR